MGHTISLSIQTQKKKMNSELPEIRIIFARIVQTPNLYYSNSIISVNCLHFALPTPQSIQVDTLCVCHIQNEYIWGVIINNYPKRRHELRVVGSTTRMSRSTHSPQQRKRTQTHERKPWLHSAAPATHSQTRKSTSYHGSQHSQKLPALPIQLCRRQDQQRAEGNTQKQPPLALLWD